MHEGVNRPVADAVLFGIGAVGYGLIELVWRGKTHPSMLLAGGVCALSIVGLVRRWNHMHYLYKCILGSGVITTVELLFGCVFNIMLRQKVWDYSNIPLNLEGQICLLFSVLWGFLCALLLPPVLRLYERLLGENKH